METIVRPTPAEFAPYYARYIDLVPEGSLLDVLRAGGEETGRLLAPLSESVALTRYAPGKWSVKEVVAHVTDAERVFGYRALRFARQDATPLPGFDEGEWIAKGNFGIRTLKSLASELRAVRAATIAFFENLEPEAWDRLGTANDVSMSVRAVGFVIAGHEIHHRKILRERYLR